MIYNSLMYIIHSTDTVTKRLDLFINFGFIYSITYFSISIEHLT